MRKAKAVAFHCKAGKDRSPLALHVFLAAIAYDDEALMPDDERAWECIKSKRPAMQHQQARPPKHFEQFMDMAKRRKNFFETQVHNVRGTVPKWFRCNADCDDTIDLLDRGMWNDARNLCICWQDPCSRGDAEREFERLWPALVRGLPVVELDVLLRNFAFGDGRTFRNAPAAGKGKGKPKQKKHAQATE